MINLFPLNLVERSDSFACVTPTLSPRSRGPVPTHTPRPLSPRRAKEGANSRIWPCLLSKDVHAVGSVASCQVDEFSASQKRSPTTAVLASGQAVGTSYLQSVGQIWLLAPLSAPAGVERGGGDRGGIERQESQHHDKQNKIKKKLNWNLTPTNRGENE
jgi:hypothetical protein